MREHEKTPARTSTAPPMTTIVNRAAWRLSRQLHRRPSALSSLCQCHQQHRGLSQLTNAADSAVLAAHFRPWHIGSRTNARPRVVLAKPDDYASLSTYCEALLSSPSTPLVVKAGLSFARSTWGEEAFLLTLRLLTTGFNDTATGTASDSKRWSNQAVKLCWNRLLPLIESRYHLQANGQPVAGERMRDASRVFRSMLPHFPPPSLSSVATALGIPLESLLATDKDSDGEKKRTSGSMIADFFARAQPLLPSVQYEALLTEYRSYQNHCYVKMDTRESTKSVHLERVKSLLGVSGTTMMEPRRGDSAGGETSETSMDNAGAHSQSSLSFFDYYCLHWDTFMTVRVPRLHKYAVTPAAYQCQLHLPQEMRTAQLKPKTPRSTTHVPALPKTSNKATKSAEELARIENIRQWRNSHADAVSAVSQSQQIVLSTLPPSSLLVEALAGIGEMPSLNYDSALIFPNKSIDFASYLPSIRHWTVGDLTFLSSLQSLLHPLEYYYFRVTLLRVACLVHERVDAASKRQLIDSSMSELSAWFRNLLQASTGDADFLTNQFSKRIDRLLFMTDETAPAAEAPESVTSDSTPPAATAESIADASSATLTRVKKKATSITLLSQVDKLTSIDLPFERLCFLHHLHNEALPAHSTQLLVILNRGSLLRHRAQQRIDDANALIATQQTVKVERELGKLDHAIDEALQPKPRNDDSDEAGAGDSEALARSDEAAVDGDEPAKTRRVSKPSIRATFLSTAVRLFGMHSPLTLGCRVHVDYFIIDEWSEASSRCDDSEVHPYTNFFLADTDATTDSQQSPLDGLVKREQRQSFIHKLLEYSPLVRYSHNRSDEAFRSIATEHRHSKMYLFNIQPDLSSRELMFALRRLGDVKGGEIFRERSGATVLQTELSRVKVAMHAEDRINASNSSGGKNSEKGRKPLDFVVPQLTPKSKVYACVYFTNAEAVDRSFSPALKLYGINYRGHSMMPVPQELMTRVRVSGTVASHGQSQSYNARVANILKLLSAVCQPRDVASIGNRQTLNELGYLLIDFKSHDLAVEAAALLSASELEGRRTWISLEPREQVKVETADSVQQFGEIDTRGSRQDDRAMHSLL